MTGDEKKKNKKIRKFFKWTGIILLALLVALAAGIFLFLHLADGNEKAEGAEESEHRGLYVDGTSLKTADGKEVLLRGINHAHAWYPDQDEAAFDAIADTGANCVRIVLACGLQWKKDSKEAVKYVMEAARERGMIAVLEVHDATGKDDEKKLEEIVDYWIDLASVLKGSEDYCIVNIANEWMESWDYDKWSEAYIKAIPRLREAGIENLLMVDSAGWGQFGVCIRMKGVEVFNADPLKNTMFSVHMYGISGGSNWMIRYMLEGATRHNLCVCVGEFGYKHSDGDVKEDYLMKYCFDKKIGYMAWSWKGNSGGVEYLDLSIDWAGKNLSSEWGENVVNGKYGIKKTSEKVLD